MLLGQKGLWTQNTSYKTENLNIIIIKTEYLTLWKSFCHLDNGPHYHNTGFILYLAEVSQAFQLTLVEYNNFEAGEGKSKLDTHFAHISHKIVRWVRVGNNLETGSQLGDLIGVCIFDLCSNYLRAPIIFSNVWNMPYPVSFLTGNPSPPSNYVPQLSIFVVSLQLLFSCLHFLVTSRSHIWIFVRLRTGNILFWPRKLSFLTKSTFLQSLSHGLIALFPMLKLNFLGTSYIDSTA